MADRMTVTAPCQPGLRYGPMRFFFMFLFVLLLIGGGMRLAGAQIPILDYPLGGPMAQPRIEIQQPNLDLP
jgi:hypothetical protein